MGASNTSSNLPPIRKENLRNGNSLNDALTVGSTYTGKSGLPPAPMSPSEEELPPRSGRRFSRQTSWNDGERRPSSYYDGLRSSDSDRRDERMASLEALRKRREIPVTLRSRSSSLGRDQGSILNGSVDPKSIKNETSYLGTPRNISDIRSRSSSSKRDSSIERPRRGMSSSLIESLEGSSERSRRGTSSISESLEGSDRSRRGTSSLNESRSNSPDKPILERLLQMKERHLEALLAARDVRGRSPLRGEGEVEVDCREEKSHCSLPSRPHSLNLPMGNMTESWNGGSPYVAKEAKGEGVVGTGIVEEAATTNEGSGEAVTSKKKGRHRISRFLRPDFFDTPREESAFAKKKEMEVADAVMEKERKHKDSSKSGFFHSLEKQLDRLRGGDRSKKGAPVDGECLTAVNNVMDGTIPPECLTSAKLAAEVRKAKLVGPDDATNPDGCKRSSSRVDRAINSLLQREKGKEVSESGLLKRAVGIEERARPSKSQSSGELAHYGVSGGSSLGKLVNEKSSGGAGGEVSSVEGKDSEGTTGGKLSSKVNSVLGMFRRNETEQVTPAINKKRVRRTQSLAYEKAIPDDILRAIADCALSRADKVTCSAASSAEPKFVPIQNEISPKKTMNNKTEKVKKSSKAAKEKSNAAKSKLLLQQKDKETSKNEKSSEGACNECSNEKSPRLKKESKKENVVEPSPENGNYDISVTLPKPIRKESDGNITKLSSKASGSVLPEPHSLLNSSIGSSDRSGNVSQPDCLKSVGGCPRLRNESKAVGPKEMEEALPPNGTKHLDRTATQDSLDSSSWSACSDGGVGDLIGGERVGGQRYAKGDGGVVALDPQHLRSPSPAMDSGERLGCDDDDGVAVIDDSEESVGDRIRRKSFYCRFNDVPLRRRSHHRPSSRLSSSLIYSASDLWNAEGMKSKPASSQSRDGFSPPPQTPNKPSSSVYRRSSTSPYQDHHLNPSSEIPHPHSSLATKGLRPTSSASSLAQSNGGSQVNEDGRIVIGQGMQGDTRRHLSPPSTAYQNGILPAMHLNDLQPEVERKSHHRLRKFRVPSLADGVTAPSPTHRKYNESSHTSFDGFTSLRGGDSSLFGAPNSLLIEKNPQGSNPSHLPPMGVPMPNKVKAMHKS